jgi:hypothetical protein
MRVAPKARVVHLSIAVIAVALAIWQRACAVVSLPADIDEFHYVAAGIRYADRMESGRWGEILDGDKNYLHPPLVKLAYGVAIKLTGAPEPQAEEGLGVGKPFPDGARPAFEAARWTSAVPGVAQVAITAAINPLAGLLVAIEGYHAKYTSEAYLEAIPGLFFVLALFLFERATRQPGGAARPEADLRGIAIAYAMLGIAAAGKYPFGALGLLTMVPLTIVAVPRRPLVWLALAGAALVTFFAFDPYLWPDPIERLAGTLSPHVTYAQSQDVTSVDLPWHQPFYWLFSAMPTKWHPDLFPGGKVTMFLLPLAVLGFPIAFARRRVWALAAPIGLVFLLAWPVKWPQYVVLLVIPLAICAAHAPEAVAALVRRFRRRFTQPIDHRASET